MSKRDPLLSDEWISGHSLTKDLHVVDPESSIALCVGMRLMRKEYEDLIDKGVLIVADGSERDDPYWYWPQCDVNGCNGVSGCNGIYWRETGYWCLCSEHSEAARAGEPQPEMWPASVAKEATRTPSGLLP